MQHLQTDQIFILMFRFFRIGVQHLQTDTQDRQARTISTKLQGTFVYHIYAFFAIQTIYIIFT